MDMPRDTTLIVVIAVFMMLIGFAVFGNVKAQSGVPYSTYETPAACIYIVGQPPSLSIAAIPRANYQLCN